MTSQADPAFSGERSDLRDAATVARQPGQRVPQGRPDRPGITRAELAHLGRLLADGLERQGLRSAGIVRQLARLAEETPEPEPGSCPVCGVPVVQAPTGRPRVYCSPRCRKAKHRGTQPRRNVTVEP